MRRPRPREMKEMTRKSQAQRGDRGGHRSALSAPPGTSHPSCARQGLVSSFEQHQRSEISLSHFKKFLNFTAFSKTKGPKPYRSRMFLKPSRTPVLTWQTLQSFLLRRARRPDSPQSGTRASARRSQAPRGQSQAALEALPSLGTREADGL